MVGWRHWFNGYEFEQTLGVGDGQRSPESQCAAVHGVAKSQTLLSNWIVLNWIDNKSQKYWDPLIYNTFLKKNWVARMEEF